MEAGARKKNRTGMDFAGMVRLPSKKKQSCITSHPRSEIKHIFNCVNMWNHRCFFPTSKPSLSDMASAGNITAEGEAAIAALQALAAFDPHPTIGAYLIGCIGQL
jgi:hypothetical protein